ncbi:unnamed protein product [Orchesella dallaii]|uniref:Amidase domain-containing protein n=1 Tax=Orchesella dallaii TaxID=48710 RepID=A0ABP1QBK7_9HEXA
MGIVSSLPNLVGLTAVPGVIGKTPSVVATVFKGVSEDFQQHKYDPLVPPIPWDNAIFQSKEKLRIGYFTSLPYFPAMGDTEEVVQRAKSSLESLGHTLVPFTLPDQYSYMRTIGRFLLADHSRHFNKSW